jgi:hypothetical protein
MQWWRVHRHLGAGLALFALYVQLFASFAHVHPEDFTAPSAAAVVLPDAQTPNADVVDSHARPSHDHHDHSPTHDDCPVCATIYLVSTALAAQPPLLSVPTAFELISAGLITDGDFLIVRHLPFQSRAPPAG